MALLTYEPYDSTRVSAKPSSVAVQYGDGYTQRTPASINETAEVWQLLYEDLSNEEADAIIAFFVTHGGHATITWVPPGELTERKFTCQKWNRKYPHYLSAQTITAELKEVFE